MCYNTRQLNKNTIFLGEMHYEAITQLYGCLQKESILGPLFKMLEASFELFVPLVVASMVDVGIANRSVSYVVRMGGLLLLLAAIGLTCSLTAQYFAAKAATGTATALRNNLFSHIGTLSYTEIDTIGTSTLITRMTSDINQVQNGINMTLRLLLRSPICGIWLHDHGIYRRCSYSYDICSDYSCIVRCSIWHHACKYAVIPVCAEAAG